MRCVGEIDITRPRWSERSTELVHLLLGNITNFEPGESARRIGQGRQEAWEKEQEVLERLRALRGAEGRRGQADDRPRPDVQRYREYPKYDIISRCFIYKQALLAEARRLVAAGRLREAEDAFHLTFQEFHEAVRTRAADHELIARRRAAFVANAALTPAARAHLGAQGGQRGLPARRPSGGRADRPTGLHPHDRGASPRDPGYGRRRG